MEKKTRPTYSVVKRADDPQVYKMTARQLRVLCAALRPTSQAPYDKDEKRSLPAVCWAAEFDDGRRHAESAEWTGLMYLDIDHVALDPQTSDPPATDPPAPFRGSGMGRSAAEALYAKLFEGREEKYGIVHAQVSPSGEGLHIVFIPSNGGSIEEAQRTFAEMTGLEQYDAQVKDISRMLFLTSTSDTLYDALDTLYE